MLIRTNNKCEIKAYHQLEQEGYEILKNGYPDFVAVDWKNKKVRFIEVKPRGRRLKPRQIRMKRAFELIGLKYEVLYIDDEGTIPRERKNLK